MVFLPSRGRLGGGSNMQRKQFISAVVKRSGVCRATVEQVLPAVFDEIRYQLTEGCHFVPIESFGTFAVVDIPERKYHYTYGGRDEIRTVPPCKRLKFAPASNMRREVQAGTYDPTRRSFTRHPKDHPGRPRKYQSNKKVFWRQPVPKE